MLLLDDLSPLAGDRARLLALTTALMRREPYRPAGQRAALAVALDALRHPRIRTTIVETPQGPVLEAETGPRRGPVLLYIGHLDVVVPDTPSQCRPRLIGDRLHGRGSADMLSAVAAAILMLREHADRRRGRVRLLLVLDEEQVEHAHSMAAYVRGMAIEEVFAIALEASDLRIGVQSMGALRLRLDVTGRAAHSAYPHRGHCAIDLAQETVEALRALPILQRTSPLFPDGSSLVRTTIRGGEGITSVAGSAQATLDLRYLPGIDADELMRALEAGLPHAPGCAIKLVPLGACMPAVATSPDDPGVRAVAAAIARHVRVEWPIEGRRGSADHAFFKRAIEVGVVGDGIHGAHEWADVSSMLTLLRVLRELPFAPAFA